MFKFLKNLFQSKKQVIVINKINPEDFMKMDKDTERTIINTIKRGRIQV